MTERKRREQDKKNIVLALQRCGGKIFGPDGAAELLGIKPTTLASRLKKYTIDPRRHKGTRLASVGALPSSYA
jgi:transcriptional regulator with GAF, ATPase, and Fis domain